MLNLTNQSFGRLKVLKIAPKELWKRGNSYWLCQCSCGKELYVNSSSLQQGSTKSCGCLRKDNSKNLIKNTPSHLVALSVTGKKEGIKKAQKKYHESDHGKKKVREYKKRVLHTAHYKAVQFRNRVPRLGEEKIPAHVIELEVVKALGKPCIYCGIEITLANGSCDHRISVYNGGIATIDNLEFQICKACNHCKGAFNHDIFIKLLNYAEILGIKKELMTRLKRGNLTFGKK